MSTDTSASPTFAPGSSLGNEALPSSAPPRPLGSTLVGRHIRRCNRNLFVVIVAVLLVLSSVPLLFGRYWHNYFFGPFPLDRESLLQIKDADSVEQYYVTVRADKNLGAVMVNKKKEEVIGHYVALQFGDRLLMVYAPKDHGAREWTGTLGKMEQGILNKLDFYAASSRLPSADDLKVGRPPKETPAELQPANYLPLQLDARSFTREGSLGLAIGALVVLVVLGVCSRILWTTMNPYAHPIARALAELGDADRLAAAIDEQAGSPATVSVRCYDLIGYFGRVTVTRSWLLHETFFGLDLVRLADVREIILGLEQHYVAKVLPADREYEMFLKLHNGNVVSIDFKKHPEWAQQLRTEIERLAACKDDAN